MTIREFYPITANRIDSTHLEIATPGLQKQSPDERSENDMAQHSHFLQITLLTSATEQIGRERRSRVYMKVL